MSAEEDKKAIFGQVRSYYLRHLAGRKSRRIPASGKSFDENELVAAVDAALDGWWTEGRFSDEFSAKLKKFLDRKYVSIVNSGSSANLVAISALCSKKLGEKRLKAGDEVITVAAAFPTTVNPIIQNGLVPVFCDIGIETHNIDPKALEAALSKKTRAVVLAHTLGNPFNLKAVSAFCKKHGLWLVEDCCDALGAKYAGKTLPVYGDIATFSFYPAHHITMGEGGAVVTDNLLLFRIANSIRDWGRDCFCRTGKDNTCAKRFSMKLGQLPFGYDHKYVYSELGYNLKSTDFQAAIGSAQMEKLAGFIEKRRKNHERLRKGLEKFSKYFVFTSHEPEAEPSWFGFVITLKDGCGFSREELTAFLLENNIDSRLVFAGNLLKQPYFVEGGFKCRVAGNLKNTDKAMKDSFWIGVCPSISSQDVQFVCRKFGEFLKRRNPA
ncbi:MAG: lipopolysaccharide biosynthesis protein RfbH [Candidatus Micrarchaeia archaeon]|jgi:CDP-6-deoxy-D-xylo-4-hexulose-3-dehydrase